MASTNKYEERRSALADMLLSQRPLHDADIALDVIRKTLWKVLSRSFTADEINAFLIAEGLAPAPVVEVVPANLKITGAQKAVLEFLEGVTGVPHIRQHNSDAKYSIYIHGRHLRDVRRATIDRLLELQLIAMSDNGVYLITALGEAVVKNT